MGGTREIKYLARTETSRHGHALVFKMWPKGSHPDRKDKAVDQRQYMKWRNLKYIYPRRVPQIVENPSLNPAPLSRVQAAPRILGGGGGHISLSKFNTENE